MHDESRIVTSMALLRLLSGTIELTAALIMFRLGTLTEAMKINAALGLVGPVVLILVSVLGFVSLAGKLAPAKLVLMAAGVVLIFIAATRS